jgi:hypothetical protein
MFGAILDWLDGRAVRLGIRESNPERLILWAHREAKDYRTGETYWYRMLMIRLPSFAWGYRPVMDDFGWRQWALIWFAGRRDQREGDARFVRNGFNLVQIDPRPSWRHSR